MVGHLMDLGKSEREQEMSFKNLEDGLIVGDGRSTLDIVCVGLAGITGTLDENESECSLLFVLAAPVWPLYAPDEDIAAKEESSKLLRSLLPTLPLPVEECDSLSPAPLLYVSLL